MNILIKSLGPLKGGVGASGHRFGFGIGLVFSAGFCWLFLPWPHFIIEKFEAYQITKENKEHLRIKGIFFPLCSYVLNYKNRPSTQTLTENQTDSETETVTACAEF